MVSNERSSRTPTADDPFAAPSSDPWALVGEVIAGRYRVDAIIGVGGMGSVLRCHHLGLGRDVAVKVLHPERSVHAESSARFTREARSASRLDHPNCVRVLDFGEWQQRPGVVPTKYLAMELVEGLELGRRLREPLPLRTALEYGGQILDGLDHAHARGVVHRDLKPENIIVTRIGKSAELLKLVDFGIAKILGGCGVDARMTRTGRVFGTPQYMSPEQVAGSEVDGRADLYAAGVLLYQMITGKLPFEADDPTVLMGKHLFTDVPPLPTGVPHNVVVVVHKLLAKEPDHRYATAAQARAELDIAVRELEMPTTSTQSRLYTLTRARTRTVTLGLGLSVLGVAAFAWADGSDEIATAGVTASSSPALASWVHAPAVDPLQCEANNIVAIQRMRALRDPKAALARADELLVDHPDDARLHLERARILARTGDGARALASYERALTREPQLLDARVLAEVAALAREPEHRTAALDLVLQVLGPRGQTVLVELLAEPRAPLGYRDRHRALAALEETPARASIDERKMIALDLLQANDAAAPCLAFAAALADIERDPSPSYLRTLRLAVPPKAPRRASTNDAALCSVLPQRLAAVTARVENRAAAAAAKPDAPPATSTTKARRRARSEPLASNESPRSPGTGRAGDRRQDASRRPAGRLRGLAG